REKPSRSANGRSNDAAEVSALVISEKVMLRFYGSATRRTDAFISQCCRIATFPRRLGPAFYWVHKQRRHAFSAVIPGHLEEANPESRDSGSGPADHPGMTTQLPTTPRSGTLGCPGPGSFSAACCGSVRAGPRHGSGCRGWPPGLRSEAAPRSP